MKIQNVSDAAFKKYGKVITGLDCSDIIAAMAETPCPENVVYVPGAESLESCASAKDIAYTFYGGMPVQIGYCNGNNHKLNGLEYHRDSEVNIAVTDLILLIGSEQDIENGKYDTSKVEAFLVPAGTVIEVYATTLHYAPCNANDGGFRRPMTFYDLLWYFTIYSFLGWCSEVIFATVTTGKFVNRGFLNGPVCPIYGFGMSLVLLVLLPFSDNIPLLFIGGALLTSAIELVGGWALKKFFHTTWWDYSNQPFNLGGYICLKFSILWGLCVVVVIRIVHTAIASLVHWIPFTLGAILVGIFIALFITDTIVTVLTIRKLNEKLTVINDMSARLRKESDAISNGLGRLTLLADEKITEQKQEFNEKARPVLEEKLQAQRAQLSEKYEEYRASLEDRRVKAQKSAEDLRAQWNSVTSKLQRHTQRRLLRAFPTMKNDRADEALRRLRAWMDEKKEN